MLNNLKPIFNEKASNVFLSIEENCSLTFVSRKAETTPLKVNMFLADFEKKGLISKKRVGRIYRINLTLKGKLFSRKFKDCIKAYGG